MNASTPAKGRKLADLLYDPGLPPHKLAEAYFEWGRTHFAVQQFDLHRSGRIRIGYLSGNFCTNPEVFFTLPILRHHDRHHFEVFCYSNVLEPDQYTAKFRSLSEHWRDTSRLTDGEAAQLIRSDRVEILVDLSGHWSTGRLALLALRPAPIQISFPTYPATSGLSAVDYRITDSWTDPPGMTEHLHSETLLRLDRCYCCYEFPGSLPKSVPLPAIANGFVTFGSFHRMQKLSVELLRLWAAIMKKVPNSKILFHHVFGPGPNVLPEFRVPIVKSLSDFGIFESRISFVGKRTHAKHFEAIGRADIALDAYPYHGMTITCDSLAMGVPVVTLAGRSHVSRVGVSLLSAVQLDDWIASTPQEYVEIAVQKALELNILSRLRRSLRSQFRKSPLMDATSYVRSLEEVYCRTTSEPRSPDPLTK